MLPVAKKENTACYVETSTAPEWSRSPTVAPCFLSPLPTFTEARYYLHRLGIKLVYPWVADPHTLKRHATPVCKLHFLFLMNCWIFTYIAKNPLIGSTYIAKNMLLLQWLIVIGLAPTAISYEQDLPIFLHIKPFLF